MSRKPRPILDYLLRLVACVLLFGVGFGLLATSTFALRMRDDVPAFVPGLDGPQSIALVLSALLAFLPLVAGRRFLAVFIVSGLLVSGLGGYWWTSVPWDELITESNFPAPEPPELVDFAFVAAPVVIAAFYVAGARASQLRADYLRRGADRTEAAKASAAGYLSGVAAFTLASGLALLLWALLAEGTLLRVANGFPRGIPAFVFTAALGAIVYAILGNRVRRRALARVRRPSSGAAGRAAPERSPARKSPS